MQKDKIIVDPSSWSDYELIDAGNYKKLERWGDVVTIRPEVNANFSAKNIKNWSNLAHWEFVQQRNQKKGTWKQLKGEVKKEWTIDVHGIKAELKLTNFKHLGIFPEQLSNWELIKSKVNPNSKVLNLFAYTGIASVIARSQGADVYHVDSVKQLISWSRKNMELSNLSDIRWVHEDAFKFAKRCEKRGQKFDLIIMDPPAYGIGAKKERWKIEDKLDELIKTASKLLEENGLLIVNTYTPKIQLEELEEIAEKYFSSKSITANSLYMKSSSEQLLYYGNLLRVLK